MGRRLGEVWQPPVAAWIDPDLLAIKFRQCIVCVVCAGLVVEPTVGCPGLHSLCRACYVKVLKKKKVCPMCRHPVDEQKLVLNRDLEGIISQLALRCKHAGGNEAAAGPSAAKHAELAPAASMAVEAVDHGLDLQGNKLVLVARLEENRMQDAGCRWTGCVGELAAHLGECAREPVTCPNKGCTETPLRKNLLDHKATCEHRKVPCGHCKGKMEHQLLVEHEGTCFMAEIECPNEGCVVQFKRRATNVHRAQCKHGQVTCPCSGCDARLLRKDIDAHVETTHLQSAAKVLQSLWSQNAVLEGRVPSSSFRSSEREAARLKATSESKQRLAAASRTS